MPPSLKVRKRESSEYHSVEEWKKAHPTPPLLIRLKQEAKRRCPSAFHQRYVSFGEMISDLELISKATDFEYWQNRIEQLPL